MSTATGSSHNNGVMSLISYHWQYVHLSSVCVCMCVRHGYFGLFDLRDAL